MATLSFISRSLDGVCCFVSSLLTLGADTTVEEFEASICLVAVLTRFDIEAEIHFSLTFATTLTSIIFCIRMLTTRICFGLMAAGAATIAVYLFTRKKQTDTNIQDETVCNEKSDESVDLELEERELLPGDDPIQSKDSLLNNLEMLDLAKNQVEKIEVHQDEAVEIIVPVQEISEFQVLAEDSASKNGSDTSVKNDRDIVSARKKQKQKPSAQKKKKNKRLRF